MIRLHGLDRVDALIIYIYIDIDIDIDIDMVRQADIRILSSAVQNRCVSICVCWSCCTAGRA